MIWVLYNVLFAVGYTLMLPRFLLRMKRRGGYRKGFMQRFAVYEPEMLERLQQRDRIWIHAVSVGEMKVAAGFMAELRRVDPNRAFIVSTTTSTGHAIAEAYLGPEDVLVYFPCDFPGVVKKALERLNPTALILTECELWPNLVRAVKRKGLPVIIVNGRMSTSSCRGYGRVRPFVSRILAMIDLFLVQTDHDRERLESLGALSDRIHVIGTVKYDTAQASADGAQLAREVLESAGIGQDEALLVGGSTWPGEEAVLLKLFKRLKQAHAALKLVLVPRHAERGDEVEREIQHEGLSCLRRSRMGQGKGSGQSEVVLVDTTGEIVHFYACASVIFVGKSLLHHGGQNIIEPALLGKPVVVGPHMENFPDVTSDFLAADAIVQVDDEAGLERALRVLIEDRDECEAIGARARSVVDQKRGATRKSVQLMEASCSL